MTSPALTAQPRTEDQARNDLALSRAADALRDCLAQLRIARDTAGDLGLVLEVQETMLHLGALHNALLKIKKERQQERSSQCS